MTTIILTIASLLIADGQSSRSAAASPSIVFVCEHGAAKSVIATAYFNKLAEERGLPYRATFRGTSPQDELSTRAIAGESVRELRPRLPMPMDLQGPGELVNGARVIASRTPSASASRRAEATAATRK
jgi:hypothetical protein